MNYEKKYKEAQKWIESIYSELSHEQQMEAEAFFPELAESKDERIRKEIIKTFKILGDGKIPVDINYADIFTWLEKQCKESSWKPSKEEMDVLYGLAYITNQYDERKEEVITRLYQDLKREFFNGSSYENMFPTNTSMEEDVRRRSTIQVLEYARSLDAYNQYGKADIDKNIAWLEKQGEHANFCNKIQIGDKVTRNEAGILVNISQLNRIAKPRVIKPADKVEPKFHEGEWITNGNYTWKIAEVSSLDYALQSQDGKMIDDTISHVDEQFHSFTIQDAKEGDVLASELCDSIILFRGIKDNNVDFYCDYDFSKIDIPGDRFSINDGQHYGDVEDSKDFHPATKEQRDTLLKAMTDAGWEFDFEKKELKKIESTNKVEPFDKYEGLTDFERTLADICTGWIGEELGWKQYIKDNADVLLKIAIKKFNSVQDASFEQKSAWSEEDEHRINRISDFIWKNRKGDTDEIYQQEQDVNWLKSLKNKVQPQPKHEWSEEDKKMIGRIRSIVEKYAFSQSAVDVNGDLCEKEYIDTDNWLKSLKDRVRPKQEWSKEDETKMRAALAFIKSEFPKKGDEEIMKDTIAWLKSLKPQNTWKPSEEQMEALGMATDVCSIPEKYYTELSKLYFDLKKLKE